LHTTLKNSSEGQEHLRATLSGELPAAHRAEIEQEYLNTLGRSADNDGLNYFERLMQSGELTLTDLHTALQNSSEGQEHQVHLVGTKVHMHTDLHLQ
jgi:hypothetical protein